MQRSWWAIVPVRSGPEAKSRLAGRSASDRADLANAFARDVVQALSHAAAVERVVIAGNVPIPDTLMVEDPGHGLNAALTKAAAAIPRGCAAVVVLGDLPCVRTQDVDRALALAEAHDRAFVSDAEGTGTAALMSLNADRLAPMFGPRSSAAHARSGAIVITDPALFRLRRDVDTEVALWDARRIGVGTETSQILGRIDPPAQPSGP